MGLTEYEPGTAFSGVIGRTTDESSPAWPRPLRAAPGSPNVLIIVFDDVGYGQFGCYGSPIATPNLDARRRPLRPVVGREHSDRDTWRRRWRWRAGPVRACQAAGPV